MLHLAIRHVRRLAAELTAAYGPDCPVVVVSRATQPDELVLRGTLADIADQVEAAGLRQAAVILVGRALAAEGSSSRTSTAYAPGRSAGRRRSGRSGCRPAPGRHRRRLLEQAGARADHGRVDEQPVLVDQALGDQARAQLDAAGGHDVASGLVLELVISSASGPLSTVLFSHSGSVIVLETTYLCTRLR